MALNPDNGIWEWSEFQAQVYTDITEKLGNTERAQLRALAVEGGPLWYIQVAMADYEVALRNALAKCELDQPEGLHHAKKLQSEMKAVDWQRQMWARILSMVPEVEENKDD